MLCGDCALNKGLTRTVRLPRGQARDGRRLETTGSVMAHTKLRSLGDVDEGLFASWLVQARELELSSDT